MKLLKMLTPPIKATVIALMASAAFGDIYVAVNDPNAGDTAVEGRGTEDLPYKTLQAAMEHDGGLASGTTVWVKPGTYAEGGAEADNNSNRVVVAAGVIVRATGTAEETIIQGASDQGTIADATLKGIGPKAVRCAYLNNNAVLRGFTLKGGRCRANTDTCGYGGCMKGGTIIDCIVTGNRGRRGGALSSVTAIRCLIKSDNSTTYSGSYAINGSYYNCVFLCSSGNYDVYQPNLVVNCTFYGKDSEYGVQQLMGPVYNSLFVGAGLNNVNGKVLHNTLFGSTKRSSAADSAFLDGSIVTNDASCFPINDRYAPMKANAAVGRCTDYDAYVALFPEAHRSEAAYDFYGNPRKGDGESVFDVGAVERDDAIDPEDWYVDADKGDDDYEGADKGFAAHPYKTLQAAMENDRLGDFHVVHVKPGTYAEGNAPAASGYLTVCRVAVKANVTLESTDGPAVTVIKGADGCRCVMLGANAVLRGFTLEGGKTTPHVDGKEENGGGIGGGSGTVIDCIIRNCSAYRGGGASTKADFIRCQFFDNTASYTGSAGFQKANYFNCLFKGSSSYLLYQAGKVVNCTFMGSATSEASHDADSPTVNSLYLMGFYSVAGTFQCCCFGTTSTKPSKARCDDRCQFSTSTDAFLLLENFAPSRQSRCVDMCTNYAAYVALFPTAWKGEAALDLYGRPRKADGKTTFDVGCIQHDAVLDEQDWFVDAVHGDDGYVGDGKGRAAHPYRTLQAAMENPDLKFGETVNVLPGVYREGGALDEYSISNRVVVPRGVTLESTGGSGATVIEGAPAPGKQKGTGGAGPYATRCARLGTLATIRGFTLRGGHASPNNDSAYGGGVCQGTVVDCVITDCYAGRGGATSYSTVNRCKVYGCGSSSLGSVYQGTVYNTYFGEQVAGYHAAYTKTTRNCTFAGSQTAIYFAEDADKCDTNWVRNCVFLCPILRSQCYANCAFATNCPGAVTVSDVVMGPGSIRCTVAECAVKSDGALGAGSVLVDKGDAAFYTLFDGGEWDYFGDRRFRGEAIDIGCAEYNPDRMPSAVTVVDPEGILILSGLKTGENRLAFGATSVNYSISRPTDTKRYVRGLYVNGAYVSFDDHEPGWAYTGTFDATTPHVDIVGDYEAAWYVDPEKGNDKNRGNARSCPFKTLQVAFANPEMEPGDTVYALPGEYASGTFDTGNTLNRVHVPANIRFVSTDGPAVTVIRGARAAEKDCVPTYAQYGIGTNSVRAVKLDAGAELRGFTVTDGTAWGLDSGTYHSGGNIVAAETAYVVDCIITNGTAMRGGGAEGGNYVRCRFTGNRAVSLGSALYGNLKLYGCVIEKGKSGGYCWYINQSAGKNKVVNSIFTADNDGTSIRDNSDAKGCDLYNTIDLLKPNEGVHYHAGCITVGKVSTSVVDPGVIVTNAAAVGIGEGGVPARDSLATDTGVYEDFVSQWPSAYRDEALRDLVGTERFLNRTIDVGAVEYDWKQDFAAELSGQPKFAVTAATTNVVLGADGGVVLSDGERMSAAWGARGKTTDVDYGFTVTVTGTGILTYAVDGGEPVAVPAGTQTIALKGTNAAKTFDFAFTGDGSATLTSFTRRANVGVILLVR